MNFHDLAGSLRSGQDRTPGFPTLTGVQGRCQGLGLPSSAAPLTSQGPVDPVGVGSPIRQRGRVAVPVPGPHATRAGGN